jgi:hypothetical protein
VEGRWTEVEVREGGVWKIRLLTVAPKIEPNAITPRIEANSVIPRVEANFISPRTEANPVTPRIEANSVIPRTEANSVAPRMPNTVRLHRVLASASGLRRRQIAITMASVTSWAVIAALIDQPTTRLENRSITAAR